MGYALTATPISRGFMFARDFLLPLPVFAIILSFPFQWVVWSYIVFGQAHFLMTYIYQARGKKMTHGYLVIAALLAVCAAAYFILDGSIIPLILMVSVLFAAHFSLDELTLHDESWTKSSLISVALFTCLFFSFVLVDISPTFVLVPGIAALIFTVYVAGRMVAERLPSVGERYLWYIAVIVAILSFTVPSFSALNVLACIIWLHGFNWAIGYGVRLRGRGAEEPRYWGLTIVTFAGSLVGWALFQFWGMEWLGALFALGPYYAWAIAHILLSFYASISFAQARA